MSAYAETVAAIAQEVVADNNAIAVGALFFYDYLITLDSEVDLFWKAKFAGPSIIFLLNRYLTFVVQFWGLAPFPTSFQALVDLKIALSVFADAQYLPWAAFSALRSYALCEGRYRWVISAIVFALSSAPTIVNLVCFAWMSYVNDPIVGLEEVNTISVKLRTTLTLVSRGSLVAADLIVLCVTWHRTYETVKMSRGVMADYNKRSLSATLLRDGTLYFLSLLIFNVVDIVFQYILDGANPQHWGLVLIFSEPITSIVTSRFLINLQQVKRRLEGPPQSLSELDFVVQHPDRSRAGSGFIGTLGGHLSFHGDDVEEWEEDS